MNVVRGILSILLDLLISITLAVGDWLSGIFRVKKEVVVNSQTIVRKSNAELEAERKFREKVINKSTHYDAHRR